MVRGAGLYIYIGHNVSILYDSGYKEIITGKFMGHDEDVVVVMIEDDKTISIFKNRIITIGVI